jgi:hypothetical protein
MAGRCGTERIVSGVLVNEVKWSYDHSAESGVQEKGSISANKGPSEKFLRCLYNVKRTGESASADHVAGTKCLQEDN